MDEEKNNFCEKPTIKHITEDENGIVEFFAKLKVHKSGNGGSITLPKKLIGEIVCISFNSSKANGGSS